MTKFALATAALLFVFAVTAMAKQDNNRGLRERNLKAKSSSLWLWNAAAYPFTRQSSDDCPDVSPISADEFDLTLYQEKSWFIQKQQLTEYQPREDLYCVTATYNIKDDGYIGVRNTGNSDSVDGDKVDSDEGGCFAGLAAEQVDGGQLRVAPSCFQGCLFPCVAGAYWVVALETDDAGDYSWAIVSGGAPTEFKEEVDGIVYCTTPQEGRNSGLWLLTRDMVADQATINTMEAKLTELGYYTGDLIDVPHENCTYPDTVKT